MENQQHYAEKTVVIDWRRRTIGYADANRQIVKVRFREDKKIDVADAFHVFCVVAIIQRLYTDDDRSTIWSYFDDALWGSIMKELEWTCARNALMTHWSRVRNADPEYVEVTVNAKLAEKPSDFTLKLFSMEGGSSFFGPRIRLPGGKYELWFVQFVGQEEEDPKFSALEEVVRRIGTMRGGDLLPGTRGRFVEVVHGVSGKLYELDGLRSRANESIFIVGPNLYNLAKDEVKALDQKTEIDGHHRGELRNWLKEGQNRSVEMLICDPASEAAVLHYAMVSSMDFITCLCKVIPRYQLWQNEMGDMGLDIRVTNAVPLSLVAIDAKSANLHRGLMTVAPLAFEPKPGVRPTFIIKRSVTQIIFDDLYEAVHERFTLNCTRSVLKVSNDELTKCGSLVERLKGRNLAPTHVEFAHENDGRQR